MKRRITKDDSREMTDDIYISYCHDIIDYLETQLANLTFEHHMLMRYTKKDDLEKWLKDVTKP